MSAYLDSLLDAERRGQIAWSDAQMEHGEMSRMRRAIHAAAQEADALQAETEAKREHLTEQLQTEIDRGDANVPCFFAGKRSRWVKTGPFSGEWVKVQETLGDILADGLDVDDSISFHHVADYLMRMAGEGDKDAQDLLQRIAAAWVGSQL